MNTCLEQPWKFIDATRPPTMLPEHKGARVLPQSELISRLIFNSNQSEAKLNKRN